MTIPPRKGQTPPASVTDPQAQQGGSKEGVRSSPKPIKGSEKKVSQGLESPAASSSSPSSVSLRKRDSRRSRAQTMMPISPELESSYKSTPSPSPLESSFRPRAQTMATAQIEPALREYITPEAVAELQKWRAELSITEDQLMAELRFASDDNEDLPHKEQRRKQPAASPTPVALPAIEESDAESDTELEETLAEFFTTGYWTTLSGAARQIDKPAAAGAIPNSTPPLLQDQSLKLLLKHTSASKNDSLLVKILRQRGINPKSLPDYEKDRLSMAAIEALSENLEESLSVGFVGQKLSETLDRHTSCLEALLPDTAEVLKTRYKSKSPVTLSQLSSALDTNESGAGKDLIDLISRTLNIIRRSPYESLDGVDYQGLVDEAGQLVDTWADSLSSLNPEIPGILRQKVESDLQHILKEIAEYQLVINVLRDNDFRSTKNYMDSLNTLFDTAFHLLADNNEPTDSEIYQQLATLQTSCFEDLGPHHNMIARLVGVKQAILQILRQSEQVFDEQLVDIIRNKEGRQGFSKELRLKYDDQYQPATVHYVPAACMTVEPPDVLAADLMIEDTDIAPFKIHYNGLFCPSMKRDEDEHAVNLMVVTMETDGECIYKEIRVGIPYAFAVAPERRDQVTELRLEEVMTAALLQSHQEQLQEAMSNSQHQPIDLPMFYDCLLSPDWGRLLVPEPAQKMGIDPELVWCKETKKKIDQINGQGVKTLTIYDRTGQEHQIRVRPKIRMDISPCNNMAFDPILALSGTWDYADKVTRETAADLIGSLEPGAIITGEAGEMLSNPDCPPVQKQQIRELATLIRQSLHKNRHHELGNHPMHPGNLIDRLAELLGYTLVIGCKSAKDRTGNKSQTLMKLAMDCHMATKKWRRKGDRGPIVANAHYRITQEELFNSTQLVLNSGQTENQQKNTAIPGYKMKAYMLGLAKAIFHAVNRGATPVTPG